MLLMRLSFTMLLALLRGIACLLVLVITMLLGRIVVSHGLVVNHGGLVSHGLAALDHRLIDGGLHDVLGQTSGLRKKDKFNVEGDEVAIQKARKTKCGTLLSGWTHRLYKHSKRLRDTNNEEHARNNYPEKLCTQDQWTDLIDNKWNDPKFLHQSAVNSANRARKRTNHVCGSSSFAMKAHQLLVEKNGDIDFPDFYHSCHFSKSKNEWVSSDCRTYHDEMIKLQENHNLQPNATPLSAEKLSVQCLGARSGIVKGLGMRSSSSSRSLVASIQTIEQKMEEKMERKMAEKISEIQSTTLSQI